MIPAPLETEAEFALRVAETPFSPPPSDLPEWKAACATVKNLFSLEPQGISVVVENEGLSFWEAAATFQEKKGKKLSAHIQIPKEKRRGWLKHFIAFDEVLAHEMIHVARAGFNEERFEEILAYQTSSKPWRRILGPLWKNPNETRVLIVLLLLAVFGEWMGAFFSIPLGESFFLPLSYLGFLSVRLMRDYRTFKKCLHKLSRFLKVDNPLPFALCLTDQEIAFFAQKKESDFL